MAFPLSEINTLVLLMFENRSFDHMLGHLSLENSDSKIDGLRQPLTQYSNTYQGDKFPVHRLSSDLALPSDVPHEAEAVAVQLREGINGKFAMTGFVEAYAAGSGTVPNLETETHGFLSFLAGAGYQFSGVEFLHLQPLVHTDAYQHSPNRTMAFCGESPIFKTKLQAISANNHLLKWMDKTGVRWRVYHDGLSFFTLYPSLWPFVLGNQFRDYEEFFRDMTMESDDTAPQVIIVEPSYQSSAAHRLGPAQRQSRTAGHWLGRRIFTPHLSGRLCEPEKMEEHADGGLLRRARRLLRPRAAAEDSVHDRRRRTYLFVARAKGAGHPRFSVDRKGVGQQCAF